MGKRSKDKGYRGEHEIVAKLNEDGIDAHRIPLSGAVDTHPGDVMIVDYGLSEVKWRETIGKYLWDWLSKYKALFLRRNHYPWLVVLSYEEWRDLMRGRK